MSIRRRCCSALLRHLIFDVAAVRLELRQPTHADQPVVSAAINIAGGVFAAVAGDDLTDQLDIPVLHVGHFFFGLAFSAAAGVPAASRASRSALRRSRFA